MKSTFPSIRPKESEWLNFIGIASRFNMAPLQSTMTGQIIANGMNHSPFETICMVRDMYQDNPEMTTEIIGLDNIKLIQ